MKHPSVEQLRQMLVKHGLVDPCAVEDPEGFDNYRTLALIGDFWRELVEEVTGGGVVGHTCDTKQPGQKRRRLKESATAANTQRPSEPESGCESRTPDDDDGSLCYDPETDCPRCHGAGKCALLSGVEWDYQGPDYDTCPRCGGNGRL